MRTNHTRIQPMYGTADGFGEGPLPTPTANVPPPILRGNHFSSDEARAAVNGVRATIARRRTRLLTLLLPVVCLGLAVAARAQVGQTVTWAGGNSYKSWLGVTNWSPQVVPLNNPGTNFTVTIPNNSSLTYDVPGLGTIKALDFGSGSVLRMTNGQSLLASNTAWVKGQIEVDGAGSGFRVPTNAIVSTQPRLLAKNGGQVAIAASGFVADSYCGNVALLSAIGPDSLVDLQTASSMQISSCGNYIYSVNARTNGTVDLSGLGIITGPSSGWLDFNIDNGGNVRLDKVTRISGGVRFSVGVPLYEVPLWNRTLNATWLNVTNNSVLRLPVLDGIPSGGISIATNGYLEAPMMQSVSNAQVNLSRNAVFRSDRLSIIGDSTIGLFYGSALDTTNLNTIANSTINVATGAVFVAPNLRVLDTVPIHLTNDGAFIATNLTAYRNNDLQIIPGRNFQGGLFTDLYGSRISVRSNLTYRVAATSYEIPVTYALRALTLFSATDAGTLLDLSSLRTLTVNYDSYYGDNIYTIAASNGGVVDLSGLETVVGANGGARWLEFRIDTGGDIHLPALREMTRRTRFVLDLPYYELPSLQSVTDVRFAPAANVFLSLPSLLQATNTTFDLANGSQTTIPALQSLRNCTVNLADGSSMNAGTLQQASGSTLTLGTASSFNASNLTTLDNCPLSLGFASSFNAPSLVDFLNTELVLAPARLMNVPPFQNLYGSRIQVSGGVRYRVAATSYEMPYTCGVHYRTTIFSATDAGSLLDLSSLRSLQVNYDCSWGDTIYTIAASNGGGVDLSGLETVVGANSGSRWLEFKIDTGGDIRLPALREMTRRTRFVLDLPYYELPSLQSVTDVRFAPAANAFLSLPSLLQATNTTFDLANGSQATMPALQSLRNCTVNLADGSSMNAGTLQQASGSTLTLGTASSLSASNLTTLDSCPITLGFASSFSAPSLTNFLNTELVLAPARLMNVPPFQNLYGSRIQVSGGGRYRVAATSYEMPYTCGVHYRTTIFSATDVGSLLDLSSLRSLQVNYDCAWGDTIYTIAASNGGVVDLSGLDTVVGAYAGSRWLEFKADAGGLIKLGSLGTDRRARFIASSGFSRIESGGLFLRSPSTVLLSGRSLLEIKGDLFFDHTDLTSIVITNAYVQMDGVTPQRLEVGGKNLGPNGATSGNFGYSQLIVGNTNHAGTVRLVDTLNNGQRGPAGEPEALYLYGMDGQGLRLLSGSRLALDGLNCYAAVNGQMVSLNSLIPPGTNSVPFDGGFLANSGGPRITNMTPSVSVTPAVSAVDVTFEIPINPATFTLADVSITGPAGAITPLAVTAQGGNTYRVSFAPQSLDGAYTVRVGPAIDEVAGHLGGMDQDGDGLSGESNEDTFTGTFAIDGTPPTVASAFAVQNGTRVGVVFNETVVPAFATNPANYSVNGSAPTRAVLQSDGKSVALTINPIFGDTFGLVVNNVVDPLGNQTNLTFAGALLALEARDIGSPGSNPIEAGATTTFVGEEFEIRAGGANFYWNGSDAGHFLFEPRTGDFDVRARVMRLDLANPYSQAGLMWRESLAANSRHAYICANPTNGGNTHYAVVRSSTGSAGVDWPYTDSAARSGVPLPNAWLRLKRSGSLFIAYRGTNGTTWTELARLSNSFPAAGYLGLAASANINSPGQATTARFANFSDLTPAILSHPQSQTNSSGSDVTFGVSARGLPVLSYQWFHNSLPLPGATNDLLFLPGVTVGQVGDYLVVVSNPSGSTTSLVATLVVDGVGVGVGGFEADVAPLPGGNNAVTVSDWVRVGRLVVRLDTPINSSEIARADCAPRTNALLGTLPLGDGRLSVADWTQAGRYAAALDPLTPAGGPSGGGGGGANFAPLASPPADAEHAFDPMSSPATASQLRVNSTKAVAGQSFPMTIELVAQGTENAVGFSVQFDPARLAYQSTALGDAAVGALLQVNANQATHGSLGIALARSVEQTFGAGSCALVTLWFRAVGEPGATAVSLTDAPVIREIAGANAELIPTAFTDGQATLIPPAYLDPRLRFTTNGLEFHLSGPPGEAYRVEVSPDLRTWESLATVIAPAGTVVVRDPAASGFTQRFYRVVAEP